MFILCLLIHSNKFPLSFRSSLFLNSDANVRRNPISSKYFRHYFRENPILKPNNYNGFPKGELHIIYINSNFKRKP